MINVEKINKKFYRWWRENWLLVIILIFALAVRMVYPLTHSFTFQFDQGKDALAVLDLVRNKQLKFVGPWTSIPGLYFGAAWYYILGFFYIIGDLQPVSAIWGMIFLLLIQIWLTGKYFNKTAAIMMATGQLWLTISLSAWNPFPLTFVSLLIIIILKGIYNQTQIPRQLDLKSALSLGFLAGLGFHFSSAYAFFYFFVIPLSLIYLKVKLKWKEVCCALIGGIIAFIPQILFEIKNNFGEVKAIFNYFHDSAANPDTNLSIFERVSLVLQKTLGEIQNAVFPRPNFLNSQVEVTAGNFFILLFLIMLLWWFYQLLFKKNKTVSISKFWLVLAFFIIIPLMGLSVLHFNIWYLLGMMPAVAILMSEFIEQWPRPIYWIWLIGLIVTPITKNYVFWQAEKEPVFARLPQFIKPKLEILAKIKNLAEGEPYAVYTYQPDIYDFAWQYLFFIQEQQNHNGLPVEFAYAPNVTPYIVEKERIKKSFNYEEESEKASKIFYIVEGDLNGDFFNEWRQKQVNPNIEEWQLVTQIGDNLRLFVSKK